MVRTEIALINRRLHDLNPLILGKEDCLPAHRFGPAARNYTLIHFVVEGEGTFWQGGVEHPVHRGQAFIIRPDEITTYQASETNPWHYRWIGFDGALSAHFASLPPVFGYTTDWAGRMLSAAREYDTGVMEYAIAAELHLMYAELFASKTPKNDYVATAKTYVRALYMQPLRVEEIAENMHLDRRYLSRIFKERVGKSIQGYIVTVRIEEAKRLLERGIGVAETARLCGYEDACNFSKMFKRECGVSPALWRREHAHGHVRKMC